jgi:hypothetical protein
MLKNQRKDTYQSQGQSLQAPLLQVPPASRGEPRMGSVPPPLQGQARGTVLGFGSPCEQGEP